MSSRSPVASTPPAKPTPPAAHPRVVGGGGFPVLAGLLDYLGIDRVRIEEVPGEAFLLVEEAGVLELRPPHEHERIGIRAVFPPDADASPSVARGRGPLAKAFGPKIQRVWDLTAGLGADAYRLAASGYEVRAHERHPAVFALLSTGWGESVAAGRVPKDVVERLSFAWGDAVETSFDETDSVTGVYLDPMYPAPKRASALPKRPLQVLRKLLEDSESGDAGQPVDSPQDASLRELAERARTHLPRLVVKRPHHAPPLLPDVSHAILSKLMRFDVYVNPARMEGAAS